MVVTLQETPHHCHSLLVLGLYSQSKFGNWYLKCQSMLLPLSNVLARQSPLLHFSSSSFPLQGVKGVEERAEERAYSASRLRWTSSTNPMITSVDVMNELALAANHNLVFKMNWRSRGCGLLQKTCPGGWWTLGDCDTPKMQPQWSALPQHVIYLCMCTEESNSKISFEIASS